MRIPPRSGAVVAWFDAVASGACGPDDAERGIVGSDALHLVRVAPGVPPVRWTEALGRIRARGCRRMTLALPVPGDPAGLGNAAGGALAAGEAVALEPGSGVLVPEASGPRGERVVTWTLVDEVRARSAPGTGGLAEADRALRAAILQAAEEMERLGLDRPRPDVAARLRAVERRLADQSLPSGLPQRAVVTLRTAGRLLAVVDLALEDDGAAVTASEIARRRSSLQPLAVAGRRALEAAYSAATDGAVGSVDPAWTTREPFSSR